MPAAFDHFMSRLVDYAGLFPPASLDMASAVANYDRYRRQADVWMLGRFICPADRLEEMRACLPDDFASGGAWECSVLVGHPSDPGEALARLARQLGLIRKVVGDHRGQLVVPALEMPIPAAAVAEVVSFLAELQGVFAGGSGTGRDLYLEVPAGADPATDGMVLDAIARSGFRAKFRCGGVTPEAFPSLDRLAGVIATVARLELPLKCTAGLHHPVRHQAIEPPVMMHGFINVFGAGLLAYDQNLETGIIRDCLAETDPAAFRFSDGAFRWRDHEVAAEAVARWRDRMLSGFGSCSFDEPREDLRGLGLLD